MERVFVLASHGTFAEGIYSSVKMIAGEKKNIHIINAYIDGTDLAETVREVMDAHSGKEVVVITDILGGSINNEFEKYIQRDNFHLIAGMNLALLVELFLMEDKNPRTAELIQNTLQNARKAMVYCNENFAGSQPDEDF